MRSKVEHGAYLRLSNVKVGGTFRTSLTTGIVLSTYHVLLSMNIQTFKAAKIRSVNNLLRSAVEQSIDHDQMFAHASSAHHPCVGLISKSIL